ncbi:trypsin-like serine protease [Jiangella muralis]|uniref:trypsin-like serine protease n=1 Tax=Jiangella muralis TaxID=702383 RepID=UPI0012F95F24|nr:trypsin-like serine protease [Jiangella muralis]
MAAESSVNLKEQYTALQASAELTASSKIAEGGQGAEVATVHWSAEDEALIVAYKPDPNADAQAIEDYKDSVQQHFNDAGVGHLIEQMEVSYTDSELLAAAERLSETDTAWAGDLADLITIIGPDPMNSAIYLATSVEAPGLAELASTASGYPIRADVSGPIMSANRVIDTSPWTAGNALTDIQSDAGRAGEHVCTQGFGWISWATGNEISSTAGHCFALNASVYQGNPNQRIGFVSQNHFAGATADAAAITLRSGVPDTGFWLGRASTEVRLPVHAADPKPDSTGTYVCVSGATTDERCGSITLRNQILRYSDGTRHLRMSCAKMDPGPRGGDSGGPVYAGWVSAEWNVAYGQLSAFIVPGSDGKPNQCAAIFSPAVEISGALQATIMLD